MCDPAELASQLPDSHRTAAAQGDHVIDHKEPVPATCCSSGTEGPFLGFLDIPPIYRTLELSLNPDLFA